MTWRGVTIIFEVGNYVAHPGHGGCTIQAISRREFAGETKQYLVLIPTADPHTTILAPVDNVEKIGIRRIISSEKANQILTYFSDVEVDWVSDHTKRKNTYATTLREGNLTSIAKMIKELVVRESEATLNHSDKEMLPRAQKKLFSEIALAKGICYESALELIDQAI